MKTPLFEYPSFQYEVDDWENKKNKIIQKLKYQKFVRKKFQNFETDKETSNNYLEFFIELIKPQLKNFCAEVGQNFFISKCWSVQYRNGDDHPVHNHGSFGFSGILYLEYDPKVHDPTYFIAPWQDPKNDTSIFGYFNNIKEGIVLITPSSTLHYVPINKSDKVRSIIAFDLLPKNDR